MKTLLILLLTLSQQSAFGWTNIEHLRFTQFSTPEGLPASMVHEVYMDRQGYIWISSYHGLFRYDGYEVLTLKSNLYSPGTLINNNVICVREDLSNRLWIGTHGGVNMLDKRSGAMRTFNIEGVNRQRINDILVTTHNEVFFAHIRGLAYYDAPNDSVLMVNNITHRGKIPEQVNVQALLLDTNGDILIGTWNDGLYRYRTDTRTFVHYPMSGNNAITALFMDSRNQIWIGTNGHGLLKASFSNNKSEVMLQAFVQLQNQPTGIASNFIYSIAEDLNTNTLWLATRNGLSIMDLQQEGRFYNYQSSGSTYLLPVYEVNSVMRDSNGLMWIGTKGSGVFHVDTRGRNFNTAFHNHTNTAFPDFISGLHKETNGALWVGYGYGVNYYHQNKVTRVLESKRPYAITYSRSLSQVLIPVHAEGFLACAQGQIVRHYNTGNSKFIPNNLVFHVHEDDAGNWWVGTYRGPGVRYSDGREYRISDVFAENPLLQKEITSIISDPRNYIWMATNNDGIIRIAGNLNLPESFKFKNYTLNNGLLPVNTPLCFHLDRQGRLWVGTEGSGLCFYDAPNDLFVSVHQKYQLPGDMVSGIEEDHEGNLWIGTNKGLAKITFSNNDNFSTRIFTVADGLPDHFFNVNANTRQQDTFYFGSSRGIVSFTTDITDVDRRKPTIGITEILLDGKPLKLLAPRLRQKISSYSPDFTAVLTIPPSFRNFSVRFASLTYSMPQQNKYAYRLVGYENDWNYADANARNAYYSNLGAGKYTLEMRGTNENGNWSDVRTMTIVVQPPLWATWWAFIVYFIVTALILWYVITQSHRRITLRNQLKMKELEAVKIEELNQIKLQFFTNITHELMTPLTIISSSIDELKMRFPDQKSLFNTMYTNAQRLIKLIQQILEFRKAESGNLKLRVEHGDLAFFVRLSAEGFEPLVRKRNLHLSVTCEQECMEAYFDKDKLDKILYNLLSNAAKYTPENAFIEVDVSYALPPDNITITIKDNGKGIAPTELNSIFERFYDGQYRQHNTTGTGIGLSLTRDLVELHHGTITVESEPNAGAVFSVTLPIKREAYEPDEVLDAISTIQLNNKMVDIDDFDTEDSEIFVHDSQVPTLLLTEDNEELLAVLRRLLHRDFKIVTALDGQEALEIIRNEPVNLVVSDVVMPVMNGIELTKTIKRDPDLCHIPVVLLSAKSTGEDRDEGLSAGADAYMTKPFSLAALHARIKSLLRERNQSAMRVKQQLTIDIQESSITDYDQKFLQDAIQCVTRHLDNDRFDMSIFVDEMGTSRTTLYNKIKTLTGLNTTAFVRNIRLKAACKLLTENPSVRISELAYAVGFNDPKYFSVCFKKEFGMQPSEYIEAKSRT